MDVLAPAIFCLLLVSTADTKAGSFIFCHNCYNCSTDVPEGLPESYCYSFISCLTEVFLNGVVLRTCTTVENSVDCNRAIAHIYGVDGDQYNCHYCDDYDFCNRCTRQRLHVLLLLPILGATHFALF